MLALFTTVALGSCVDVADGCMCRTPPPAWVRLGAAVETDGGLHVTGGTTFGTPAPDAGAIEGVDAGATVLATDQGVLAVDAHGRVTCGHAQQATMSASAYGQALADGNCEAALADAGIVRAPCRDVGCGCSSSVTNLSLAALITLAIRSRARRRPDL